MDVAPQKCIDESQCHHMSVCYMLQSNDNYWMSATIAAAGAGYNIHVLYQQH